MDRTIVRTIENLQRRGHEAVWFETPSEAVDWVIARIPKGASVGLGGSMTVIQTGLLDALRDADVRLLDRYKPGLTMEEVNDLRRRALTADVFISGANAITQDGLIVNMDGLGNRVAGISYGPHKVFILAGTNKVVPCLVDAIMRIRNIAAPKNARRLGSPTPCAGGRCQLDLCAPPSRLCLKLQVIEGERDGRIAVVLLKGDLGF